MLEVGYRLPLAPGAFRVGVDLGGTKIEGIVLAPDGTIVARRRIPTERERGYEHIVGRVAGLVEELAVHAPGVAQIGVGTPGALSARSGRLKNSNTTCLNDRPLDRDLARQIGRAVRVDNDANCFAVAEALAGAGQGCRVVFGVILGTGVGGGIVVDGVVWPGGQHIAGEWGHHTLEPDGPACYCGRRGCVETLLCGPALEQQYVDAGGASAGADEIGRRAASGEARAAAVMATYLSRFGRALGNVINILDPTIVVLGGGVSKLAALYDAGRDAVARHVFNDELRTPIVQHQLSDAAGVIGAALLD